jgi:hypothetical protein
MSGMSNARYRVVATSATTIAWVAAVVCAATAGCSTSGSTGTMQMYQMDVDTLWYAALDALRTMRADVRSSNRGAGVIWAAIDWNDEKKSEVQLNITVRSSGATDSGPSGSDILVAATMPGADPEDSQIRMSLDDLEQQFLDLVSEAAMGGRRRRVAPAGAIPGR